MLSLQSITNGLGSLRSGDPSTGLDGRLHPDFQPVADALRGQLSTYEGGAALCVYYQGECVVDLWGGARDRRGRAWTQDTMAPSFSTTKGIASTLIHIMRDRGVLDYEQPVANYWPEFGQAGKSEITLRHVLAHQSGLYHIRQMIDRADRMLDWDYMVKAIEQAPPVHRPGTRTGYHGLTYGFLVGEILQRATGRTFSELVADEIAEPLGLDGMYVGAPQEVLTRSAELFWPWHTRLGYRLSTRLGGGEVGAAMRQAIDVGERGLKLARWPVDIPSLIDALMPRGISTFDFGSEETLRATIPAANGLFTARSIARMYACLAQGGEIDGSSLLSPETLTLAIAPQAQGLRRRVLPFDLRWKLGYHGVTTFRGFLDSAFGHFGFGGSGAWADPERELAVGLIVNCGMGTPFGDLRIIRISDAVMRAIRTIRAREKQAA